MKKWTRAGLAIVFSAFFIMAAQAEVVVGGSYFTLVNIWRENPEKIQSTNYHVGEILPVGTPIKVIKIENGLINNLIEFCDNKGNVYTIYFVSRHSRGTFESFLTSHFSQENILESDGYKKLSEMEKENILRGTIGVGMSKAAVLLAYGYPPSHKTKTIDLNSWIYWINSSKIATIHFDTDGKVIGGGAETVITSLNTGVKDEPVEEAPPIETENPQLTNDDILAMIDAGLAETTIISAIECSGSSFDTSPATLIELKNRGVTAAVLEAMIKSPQLSKKEVTPKKGGNAGGEIMVFDGDSSRAYTVLGEVVYKHEKGIQFPGNNMESIEAQKVVRDGLKNVAQAKYGNKVNAVIHVKMDQKVGGGSWGVLFGANNWFVSGTGVAVSFD